MGAPFELFHYIQMIVVIAEDNDAIVAGHAAQRIGVRSGRPLLRGGRAVIAVAEAAAIACVRVEEHIVRTGAVALYHDGALDREVVLIRDSDNILHRMRGSADALNAALVKAKFFWKRKSI